MAKPHTVIGPVALAVAVVFAAGAFASPAATHEQVDLKAAFLALCDAGCPLVRDNAHRMVRKGRRAFYWDSYTVRALCVAYDMTAKAEYLEASKVWSKGMAEFQKGMFPKGAYYIQYIRKPGEKTNAWYVADSSSIALGVLATAVRCENRKEKAELLKSVKSFARLVARNYVRPSGGVANGLWPKSDKEWWCSSGIFGSLAFHLYAETGDRSYLRIGLGTIDWLNRQDLLAEKAYSIPTVLMYSLEAYSAAFPYLENDSLRYRAAMAQLAKLDNWMIAHFGGRAGEIYVSQWGSKYGGLPFHLYIQARFTDDPRLREIADAELGYIAKVLQEPPASDYRDQLTLFAMMSYAERLSPRSIDRAGKQNPSNPAAP
jgi:hypothetical protein